MDIDYQVAGFKLRVYAIHSRDMMEALDGDSVECHIVAAATHLRDGRRAFDTAEQVGMMLEHEVRALAKDVSEALSVISPVLPMSDLKAWVQTLRKGADENPSEAIALGHCYDAALGFGAGRIIPRPDRFFGLPFRQLTDGQWFLYHACREWMEKHTDKRRSKGAPPPRRGRRR
ncbi:hypothetical protein KKA53_05230 [Candidatus Dependentiae bacterium]|nr:hypothetical protein [Candidatus Dependentiae bacterium]